MSSVEAPAASRIRTVSTQSAAGSFAGCSPLPTAAQPRGVLFQLRVARFDVGAALEQKPDDVGASGVGSGVQGGAAVIPAASLEGEAEVEHERDGGGVALLGGAHDRCSLVVGQPGEQPGIVRELPLC